MTWSDGEVYEGRYDMTYEDSWKANLGDQIKRFVEFYAGLNRPPHMTDEQYEKVVKVGARRSGISREDCINWLRDRELT